VHVTGGGGEAGPASRCPESQLSAFLNAGITTVVGVCGTDSVSRSQARHSLIKRASRAPSWLLIQATRRCQVQRSREA
jgi:hypothetical protein